MKDFLDDDNGDIKIEDGDIVIGFSDEQHVDDLLQNNIGEIREFPMEGFGIKRYLKTSSNREPEFISDMQRVLKSDGFKLKVKLNNGIKDFEVTR